MTATTEAPTRKATRRPTFSPAGIDRRLFASGSQHRLAAVRTALAAVLLYRIALGPYRRLSTSPPEVFDPPVILSFLSRVPSSGVLFAVQCVGVAGAALVLAGRKGVRIGFALAWLSLLFLAALRTSVGKIQHNEVLLLIGCLPIVFAPAARLWDRRRTIGAGWPVRAAALFVSLVYFWAGFQKLRFSGIAWETGDNMRWTLYHAATSPLPKTHAVSLFVGDRPWMAHLMAGTALGLELLAPLLLITRFTRWLFILGSFFLHLGVYLTLGLDYWGWILTVAIVLWPWDDLARDRDPAGAG